MSFLKSAAACAAAFVSLSVFAADADLVIAVDGAALKAHPQVVKLREEFDSKAAASGKKSVAERLAEAKLDESVFDSRVSVYADTGSAGAFAPGAPSGKGVAVIDTVDGKAPALFEVLCGGLNLKDGGEKSTIAGCPAVSGTGADGAKVTLLLKSPSQIQIQMGDAFELPLNFGKINKNLVLAAKSDRLVTLAFVPKQETLAAGAAQVPSLQELRLLTVGLKNTKPEATLSLEGVFTTNDAALQTKGMVDLLLMGLQNQVLDGRFFQNLQSGVENGKLTYSRVIDEALMEAVREAVQGQLGQLPGMTAPAALPETEAQPEAPKAE